MSNLLSVRRFRTLFYTLFITTLITLILRSRIPAKPQNLGNERLSVPTYVQISPFRQNTNRTREDLLEQELIKIENTIRTSLQGQAKDIRASQTIWQITSSAEGPAWEEWTKQWRATNPQWELKQFTSSPSPDILPHFQSVPSISHTIASHPDLETDLYRWLLLWYHGGFFLEPDIWPRLPLHECFDVNSMFQAPIRHITTYRNSTRPHKMGDIKPRQISLVLGIDIDEPYMAPHVREKWGWSRGFSFATYAMWAPGRFDPLLRKAIVRCVGHAEMVGNKKVDAKEIGEVCGGAMLTDIVMDMLSENLKEDHPVRDMDAGLARRVTWKKFRSLRQPLWISSKDVKDGGEENMRGLGVLPINVWGNGQRHSGSGRFDNKDACLNHVYGRRPVSPAFWNKIFG